MKYDFICTINTELTYAHSSTQNRYIATGSNVGVKGCCQMEETKVLYNTRIQM